MAPTRPSAMPPTAEGAAGTASRDPEGTRPPAPGWTVAAASDGTPLAWRLDRAPSRAAGRPTVVLCNGIACSDAYWRDVVPALQPLADVLRWDYRGHGRSGQPEDPDATAVPDVARDLTTVLTAAGVERAVLVGHSYGVQVVLERARSGTDGIAGSVAVAGAPGHPLRGLRTVPAPGWRPDRAALRSLAPQLGEDAWRRLWRSPVAGLMALALGGTTRRAPREVMASYFEHVATRDLDVLARMFAAMGRHDASDVLDDLAVPLTACAGTRDQLTPLPVLQRMTLRAPRGSLLIHPDGSHTLPAEHPRWVARAIRHLLRATWLR